MITLRYSGDGEWIAVGPTTQKNCDARYVVGELYRAEFIEERSAQAHNRFFALVNEAWQTMPVDMVNRFPSPEHLRRYALIKTGFCVTTASVWSTPKDAMQFAETMLEDEFSVVTVQECVVTVTKAVSQRMATMRKDKFTASSNAVLDFLEEILGAKPGSLRDAA